jgi:hypothetical protein
VDREGATGDRGCIAGEHRLPRRRRSGACRRWGEGRDGDRSLPGDSEAPEAGAPETGIEIRFIQPTHEPVRTVAGVGGSGRSSIAFEFQLFPTSEQAKVEDLGNLKPREFGWSAAPLFVDWEPRIRGVLANVAYAEYELVHPKKTIQYRVASF